MYHLQKSFEASLRGGSDFSLASIKSKHKTCKGTLHATGNYQKPPQSNVKSSSVSSEGFSESDSVDSLKDEVNKKNSAICDRLHNASTKASYAKTAKMRYLEEGVDEDNLWIEDLANVVDKKRKEGGQKSEVEEKSNFVRSSSTRSSFSRGSFRKTPISNGKVSAPPVVNGKTSTPPVVNGKISTLSTVNGKSSAPSTPQVNGIRHNFLRSSIRKSVKKKIKSGCLSWEEAWFRANNRKVHYMGGDDKTNCFKDLNVLLLQAEVRQKVLKAGSLPSNVKLDS